MVMQEQLKELFQSRDKTARVVIEDGDRPAGSRIGGLPPDAVDPPTCPLSGRAMEYLLTLEHDLLPLLPAGKAISIYVTPDPDALSRSMAVFVSKYPAIERTIAVVFHVASQRGESGPASPVGGRALAISDVTRDMEELEEDEDDIESNPVLSTKIGGRPGVLQSSWDMSVTALDKNGYMFLFQFAEYYPSDDMKPGTFYFGGGTLFVYAKREDGTQGPDCDFNDIIAFWEV